MEYDGTIETDTIRAIRRQMAQEIIEKLEHWSYTGKHPFSKEALNELRKIYDVKEE